MNTPILKKLLSTLLLIFLFLPHLLYGETAEEKGLNIAREAARRHQDFGDYRVEMLMIKKNKEGRESTMSIRHSAMEVIDEGVRTLSIIDTPAAVKGTSFLTLSNKRGTNEQYLYLPALGEVKELSSSSISGSFMGSEFSYEDIASLEVGKYSYRYLREEKYRGRPCHVVENFPQDTKNSGYSRRIWWVDKKEYRLFKVEFFDRKKSLLKSLSIDGYRQYPNGQWRAERMQMVNHQSGKATTLLWQNYRFRTGLTVEDFDLTALDHSP
ncbi:MAG: outer membrane lipoprotein-sorting protein [Thermodesulfobacteriota bacterium]